MAVKDQDYRQRGIRMKDELWNELTALAGANNRSGSKEAVVAIKNHLRKAKKQGLMP